MPRKNTIQTFWDRVDRRGSDECWNWQKLISHNGYGRFRYEGKIHYSHRFAFELKHGDLSDDVVVRHFRCNNNLCCNPRHMDIDSREGTMRDTTSGMKNKNARLSISDVKEIRERVGNRENRQKVADDFRVSISTVGSVVNRKTWQHVA